MQMNKLTSLNNGELFCYFTVDYRMTILLTILLTLSHCKGNKYAAKHNH